MERRMQRRRAGAPRREIRGSFRVRPRHKRAVADTPRGHTSTTTPGYTEARRPPRQPAYVCADTTSGWRPCRTPRPPRDTPRCPPRRIFAPMFAPLRRGRTRNRRGAFQRGPHAPGLRGLRPNLDDIDQLPLRGGPPNRKLFLDMAYNFPRWMSFPCSPESGTLSI